MNNKTFFYYRIYDDTEHLNFFKSVLSEQRIRELLEEYERVHQQYFNPNFLAFIHEHDEDAEIIEITNITY
jgi:hypothetical protein